MSQQSNEGQDHKPGLDEAAHRHEQRVSQEADILSRGAIPSYLATLLPFKEIGAEGCRAYLDRLLADAGSPMNPLVKMAIEQLALSHHRIAELHTSAAQAKSAQAAVAYTTAATRLMAEHRRLTESVEAQLKGKQPTKQRRFGTIVG